MPVSEAYLTVYLKFNNLRSCLRSFEHPVSWLLVNPFLRNNYSVFLLFMIDLLICGMFIEIVDLIETIFKLKCMKIFKIILFCCSLSLFCQNSYSKDIILEEGIDHSLNFEFDPLYKKTLHTSKGDKIIIKDYYIWAFDDGDWQIGGKLHLINDDSMGRRTRITCSISPAEGDKFMMIKKRMSVRVDGVIGDYSDQGGLKIDPCNISY